MAEIGLRANEVRRLDLADVKWELGPFGKVHVRYGKGSRGSGPRERMVAADQRRGTGRCAGISRTCGASSATTTPGRALPCSPPSASRPTPGARGWDRTRCARRWLRRRAGTCRAGTASSPRTCCGTSARPGCYLNGMDLIAIQEALGSRLGSHHDAVRACPPRPCRAGVGCRSAASRAAAGRADLNALEPAAGGGEPRHLEGAGAAQHLLRWSRAGHPGRRGRLAARSRRRAGPPARPSSSEAAGEAPAASASPESAARTRPATARQQIMTPGELNPSQLQRDALPLRGRAALVTGVSRRAGASDTRSPSGWPPSAPACSCSTMPRTTTTSPGVATLAASRPSSTA